MKFSMTSTALQAFRPGRPTIEMPVMKSTSILAWDFVSWN